MQRSIMQIKAFAGLRESSRGDTDLKPGEAVEMCNFRVSEDGRLSLRPGTRQVTSLGSTAVRGLWRGYVGGSEVLLAACGGKVWSIDAAERTATDLGALTDSDTFFFGFGGNVYIMNGTEYKCWDGSGAIEEVPGYVPLVAVASPPTGGGTLLEQVNRLTGAKRQWFSPDGSAVTFALAEQGIDEVLSVSGNGGADLPNYTANLQAGTVTFVTAPPAGTDSIEISWRKGNGDRDTVTAMRFAESYSGPSDARVFLGGDGTNRTLYSGITYSGAPSAEYFPQLNVLDCDSSGTPVTALIRHYDRLLIFKKDGLFAAEYGELTLADGSLAAGFYTLPVNREVGCVTPGGAILADNSPWTTWGGGVYAWPISSGTLWEERSAQLMSENVGESLKGIDLAAARCFDDGLHREYWLLCGRMAFICRYGRGIWYRYSFPQEITAMARQGQRLLAGTESGALLELSESVRSDCGAAINAIWRSGSMALRADWRKKYSPDLWLSIKPESGARVRVSVQTDREAAAGDQVAAMGLASFVHADFSHLSFSTSDRPRLKRLRLHARKFIYYRLILSSNSSSAAATVLGVDIALREAGLVR